MLSFRADGPYWSDLVHLLAYPEGISYLWPFRYDANRIAPDLRAEVDDDRARRALAGSSVLIGARFQTAPAEDRLLPIRYATLVHVDISAGIYSFEFRLGRPLRFGEATELHGCTVRTDQNVEHLAFREEVRPQIPAASDPDLVGVCWKSFAQLVVAEAGLPINGEAKRSLFIHLGAPTRRTVAARVGRVRTTKSGADVYGYRLKQGHQYDLKYSHFVPSLQGENTTIREIAVEPQFAGKNLEINTAQATLIGNYGTQSLVLAAVDPTVIWHDLAIAPMEKQLKSQENGIEINTHSVKIPIFVSWSIRHWFWRTIVPTTVLFLALAILGAANMIDRNLSQLLTGSLKWSQIVDNWPLILIVVVGSGLASIVIPILQARTKSK